MKKLFCFIVLCLTICFATGQRVAINTDGSAAHSSSILDVKSSNRGMLIPRTSTTSRLGISNPAKGLMVYDTSTGSFWCYSGLAWTEQGNLKNTWGLGGNAGTNPANNFIGTTDNQPLIFKINNVFSGWADSATQNTIFGFGTGKPDVGMGNTAFGYKTLNVSPTSFYNSAFGVNALYSNITGSYNTAVGFSSLFSNQSGDENTAIGLSTLRSNTTGYRNTALGSGSLSFNTTGQENSALGVYSLVSNTTGFNNIAIGNYSLENNTIGHDNTAIGFLTLSASTNSFNTAIGSYALSSNTNGDGNCAVGASALYNNNNGYYNTAAGYLSLFKNTSGYSNTANGYEALYSNTSGNSNIGIGIGSLYHNTTGSGNTAVGFGALASNDYSYYNTAIGYQANVSAAWGDATAIGAHAITTANDEVMIGGPYPSNMKIGGYANWFNFSDGRFKENVHEDVPGLSFITKLRPVTYQINNSKLVNHITHLMPDSVSRHYKKSNEEYAKMYEKRFTGFVAQEVEQAANELDYDFDGVNAPRNETDHYSLAYASFVVPLVKAVQEQQTIIGRQQKQINDQQAMIEQMQKTVSDLLKRIEVIEKK